MRENFYHIKIDLYASEDILATLTSDLNNNTAKAVTFINAHCFNIAYKNSAYKEAIENSDYILNDGIGIKLAGKLNKTKFIENLNGTDLIPEIIRIAHQQNKTIYLLGTKDSVLEKTKENLEKKFEGIKIIGFHNGFFNLQQEEAIVNELNTLKPDILIVGMGVPLQELFIARNKYRIPNTKLLIAGGAILDFLSGEVKELPFGYEKLTLNGHTAYY